MKTIFAALALTLLPVLASANCQWEQHNASTCGEGQTFDENSGTCVDQVSS